MNKEKIKVRDIGKNVTAVILAAGKGTRMKNSIPKVLHPVAGKPMLQYPVESCQKAGIRDIRVVAGHGLLELKEFLAPFHVQIFPQALQLGTADAVSAAQLESALPLVLILNGDHPLISSEDILGFVDQFYEQNTAPIGVVTANLKNPKDFGRIVRQDGRLVAIVEKNEAPRNVLKINEINTGIYICRRDFLLKYLPRIQNFNNKGEYYLTDLIQLGVQDHLELMTLKGKATVAFGVNTQRELSLAHRWKCKKNAFHWMDKGVILLDPSVTYIEDAVTLEPGCIVHPFVVLKGHTQVQSHSIIESHCVIEDSMIESGAHVHPYCHLDRVHLKQSCTVGPFARLRPETTIGEFAHVGNFVEMKKVLFGPKAKAGHLTYLGDAEIGEETNIGCGTITCNYAVDRKKYKTQIGKRVFVGSDSQFVAPLKIGDDAVIGSGSTITKDVPNEALAVSRAKQVIKTGYNKKLK